MRKSSGFEPVLSSKAASFLVGLSKAKQRIAISLIYKLADFPAQSGDYTSTDESGRVVQHLLIGDWQFSFWADHAVRELRITEIEEL